MIGLTNLQKFLGIVLLVAMATLSSPSPVYAQVCVRGEEVQVCPGGVYMSCEEGDIEACQDSEDPDCWWVECEGSIEPEKHCCGS